MTFQELKLSRPVLRAVSEAGYETPSPIQAGAIPPVLAGRDLMGCAQTGTGKTAAFALPMLDRLAAQRPRKPGAVRALILTPTRELALQIGESFAAYGKYLPLRYTVIFGGVGQAPQVEALKKGVEILVACPGRLNDLIGQGLADLSGVEIFVLDEADRMLDMGFVHDVKKVIARLPSKRQNLMFSATMPKEIEELASGILCQPAFVKVDPVSSTVDRIRQSLYFVEKGNKRFLLPWLIQKLDPPVQNALVFSRTKHGADKIARELVKQGIPAAAIHGNKSQSARVAALEGFKAGKTKVLVATDIAARGIDISELSHVFNFDLPEVPETYVHRIGRTARAGADGTAVSFCAPEEREYLAGIEKLNRKKIPVISGHPWDGAPAPVKADPPPRGRRPQEQAPAVPAPQNVSNEENRMEELENRALREDGKNRRPRRGRRDTGAEQSAPRAPQRGSNTQPKFDPHFLSAPEPSAPRTAKPQQAPQAAPQFAGEKQAAPQKSERPAPRGKGGSAVPKNERAGRQNGQNAAPQNGTPNARSSAPKNAPQTQAVPQQNNKNARNAQNNRQQAAAPRKETRSTPAPAPQTAAPKNAAPAAPAPRKEIRAPQATADRSARRSRSAGAENPGLVLISRRPPQQKFASFEEYMAAHGGATAPIEDHSQE